MFKYVATGNDFVLLTAEEFAELAGISAASGAADAHETATREALSALARRACNRHYGVGADGLILLQKVSQSAIKWDFYNADGSRAAMCGNGARAAFACARDLGWLSASGELHTDAGVVRGWLEQHDLVCVQLSGARALVRPNLPAGWAFLDTGVPHLVGAFEYDEALARWLREEFDANVNFVLTPPDECEIGGRPEELTGVAKSANIAAASASATSAASASAALKIRTYERGVGETLACGTGMCAAAVAAGLRAGALKWGADGDLVGDFAANLLPKSGETVKVSVQNGEIFLEAPAKRVFCCDFE